MTIHTEHNPMDCGVCAAQQETDALGAMPTAGHQPNAANLLTDEEANLAATRMRTACVEKVRAAKYSDRGKGLEDEDPHSDNNPDYIRAAIDERLEETAVSLESITLDGEK